MKTNDYRKHHTDQGLKVELKDLRSNEILAQVIFMPGIVRSEADYPALIALTKRNWDLPDTTGFVSTTHEPRHLVTVQEESGGATRKTIKVRHLEQVRYLEADSKYVVAVCESDEIILTRTLKELEETLGQYFIRIHRGMLVSSEHIEEVVITKCKGHLYTKDIKKPLSISRRYLAATRAFVEHRGIPIRGFCNGA